MQRFIDATKAAVATGNWYAAIALALTMPDICGRLKRPQKNHKRLQQKRKRALSLGSISSYSRTISLESARPTYRTHSYVGPIAMHCDVRSCIRVSSELTIGALGLRWRDFTSLGLE